MLAYPFSSCPRARAEKNPFAHLSKNLECKGLGPRAVSVASFLTLITRAQLSGAQA